MNTTENNKKIAEFMEHHLEHPLIDTYDPNGEDYEYDTSWDWLMVVVEKIEQTGTKDGRTFTIDVHKDNVIINQYSKYGKYHNEIIVTGGGTRIENLYNACIEFVEWWELNSEEIKTENNESN